jgi:succinate dehydrogenase/fumarate reductase cytochrome b subunit
MSLVNLLKIIAVLGTAATGLLAFVKPDAAYDFTGLSANGPRGVSEIRSVFGGLFVALGLAPLFLGPTAYMFLGIGYLAIAAARTFSIVFDKSYARSNLISLGIEVVLGLILIA